MRQTALVLAIVLLPVSAFAQQPLEFEFDHALSAVFPIIMEEAATLGYMPAAIDRGGEMGPAILSLEGSAILGNVARPDERTTTSRQRIPEGRETECYANCMATSVCGVCGSKASRRSSTNCASPNVDVTMPRIPHRSLVAVEGDFIFLVLLWNIAVHEFRERIRVLDDVPTYPCERGLVEYKFRQQRIG